MELLQKTRYELAIQYNDLCNQYNELAKKLKIRLTTKTRTERIQDKVSTKIELKKLENRIKVLSKVIDSFDVNIRYFQIFNSSSCDLSIETPINKKFTELLESEYKKLDILSTKMVLANEFKTERLKGLNIGHFGILPIVGGLISSVAIGIPFQEMANLPFSLVNFLLPLGITFAAGVSATTFAITKATKQRIDVFNNLNNKLGEEALAVENEDSFEYTKLEKLVDKKINDIMIILMKQKEDEIRFTCSLNEKTQTKQFDWTQHLGRNSVENIINDKTPFQDKVLRPVGFEIPEAQSNISLVEPYLSEDIETDDVINSQEQNGPVLVKKTKPIK